MGDFAPYATKEYGYFRSWKKTLHGLVDGLMT